MVSSAPPSSRWLLIQTLATGHSRRTLQSSLPLAPGARILDVGCGVGASSLELATLRPAVVTGIDVDRSLLGMANEAAETVRRAGVLAAGSSVEFVPGDAYELPFDDESADAVFSRFVFQHLSEPATAAAEMFRVLRPGGMACVVDVDDGLSISEPPPSEAYNRLAAALRAAQDASGGDRYIGRRLASLLDFHGLTPSAVLVLPQAAYHHPGPGDPDRQLLIQRMEAARQGIVTGGHLSETEFDELLADFAEEESGPTCDIEGHLAVVATRES